MDKFELRIALSPGHSISTTRLLTSSPASIRILTRDATTLILSMGIALRRLGPRDFETHRKRRTIFSSSAWLKLSSLQNNNVPASYEMKAHGLSPSDVLAIRDTV